MKREEVGQELFNLAFLKWGILREKPDYKADFEKLIAKLNSERNDEYWSKFPLFYENYPMKHGETYGQFLDRVTKEIDDRELRGEYNLANFDANQTYREEEKNFADKWDIRPPVDSSVANPNPWSLYSLVS